MKIMKWLPWGLFGITLMMFLENRNPIWGELEDYQMRHFHSNPLGENVTDSVIKKMYGEPFEISRPNLFGVHKNYKYKGVFVEASYDFNEKGKLVGYGKGVLSEPNCENPKVKYLNRIPVLSERQQKIVSLAYEEIWKYFDRPWEYVIGDVKDKESGELILSFKLAEALKIATVCFDNECETNMYINDEDAPFDMVLNTQGIIISCRGNVRECEKRR